MLAGFLLTSCQRQQTTTSTPTDASVVARVGSRVIHAAEVEAEAARRRESGRPVSSAPQLLEEMVREELLVQAALATKLDQDPEVQRAWRNALIGTLREKQLEQKLRGVTVTPEEIRAAYDANVDKYRIAARVRVAVIEIQKPQVASAGRAQELRARADEALKLAQTSGEGFRDAAIRFSDHQASRVRGGELGWIEAGKPPFGLPTNVIETAFAFAEVGQTSGLLELSGGYYIVRLLEKSAAKVAPLEQVTARWQATLVTQKRQQLTEDFEARLRQQVPVQLHPAALEGVKLPIASMAQEATPPPVPVN